MLKIFKLTFLKPKVNFCQIFRTMSYKVFVYGTLKRNEPNHHWLTNPDNGVGQFINEGRTKTKYPLIIGTKYNIPFLLHSPGDGHNVKGEIYEVDDTMLSKLDILEDHPNYYVREIDDVIVNKDPSSEEETVKCWIYFLKNFRRELLTKPQLENYSSQGSHGLPYMERSKRDPNDNYYPEVKR
ncbi:putative gamma-glutamylcyclotransferase CG2811 isoform X2 [Nymphalis io]|uniref:putative gamma-glutamylcyclotransferase CG2811 isoform X2 n=1 Tax=Inachis io TaxID=171585 RepID=UPI002168BFE7|nr:putative gamma-glutamylcyclotransferase CG2811 isoform X2 [Nymphalis io]